MSFKKGNKLLVEASQRAEVPRMFSMYEETKYEDAAKLYIEAAVNFKEVGTCYGLAGDAYLQAAEMYKLAVMPKKVAEFTTRAGRCYWNDGDRARALTVYHIAALAYTELGEFATVAKIYSFIAHLHLELKNYDSASEAFSKCADFYFRNEEFLSDEDLTTWIDALVEVAERCGGNKEYKRAAEMYEKAVRVGLEKLGYITRTAQVWCFRALLCHLMVAAQENGGSLEQVQATLHSFERDFVGFSKTFECRWIQLSLDSISKGEEEKFEAVLRESLGESPNSDWVTIALRDCKSVFFKRQPSNPAQIQIN